ncbi:MAG TPA: hypothetical protein VFH78_14480 [Candidatus Thermoplasmatota archaeon]|nr:hypothetical protein [Candidatus Thermoplasmatota archaeon]
MRQGERDRDRGVSAVLGAILMLAVLMTLVPGMLLLRDAVADEMSAQREAAERAAFCARNPSVGPPACDNAGPMPGYDCRAVDGIDAWLCTPPGIAAPTVPLDEAEEGGITEPDPIAPLALSAG